MNKKIYLRINSVLLSLAIISGFGLLPKSVSAQKKSETVSLCQAGEDTIWSCVTTKNKIASVCGTDLEKEKGYLQYRFGVLGKLELEFPKERKDSQKAFKYSRYTRPLVTMLTLSFVNNGVVYEIHDDDNSEEKPPVRVDSIDIKDGAKEMTITCKQPSKSSLVKLEDFVLGDEN